MIGLILFVTRGTPPDYESAPRRAMVLLLGRQAPPSIELAPFIEQSQPEVAMSSLMETSLTGKLALSAIRMKSNETVPDVASWKDWLLQSHAEGMQLGGEDGPDQPDFIQKEPCIRVGGIGRHTFIVSDNEKVIPVIVGRLSINNLVRKMFLRIETQDRMFLA